MPEPGLTVCMIVRDERANLEELLPVVAERVDDVVVVDTGSTDGTAEIARSQGARVFDEPWRDDFARARNRGLAEVRTSHVLWLDGDDRISGEDVATLRNACLAHPDTAFFTLLINESNDPGNVTSCWQLRAFPARPEHRFRGRIHEQIAEALTETNTPTENLDLTIRHIGYLDPEEVIRKARRNLDLIRRESDRRRDVNVLYHWVKAAHRCGELDEASRVGRELLSDPPPGTPDDVLQATAVTLASLEFQRGDRQAAEKLLRDAVERIPDDALARFFLGDLYRQSGDLARARRELDVARVSPIRQGNLPVPVAGLRRAIRMELGEVLERTGQVAEAVAVYREALEDQPDDRGLTRALARALVSIEAHDDAEAALERLEAAGGNDDAEAVQLRATIAFDRGDDARAAALFTQVTELAPLSPGASLHLGHLALRGGRIEESREHYARALRLSDTPETRVGAAAGELEAGKYAAALDHLANAVEACHDRPLPRGTEALAGEALFRVGRPQEALAAFEKHLASHGPDARLLSRVADCYRTLGATQAARVGYQEALKLSPGLREAVQGLAQVEPAT